MVNEQREQEPGGDVVAHILPTLGKGHRGSRVPSLRVGCFLPQLRASSLAAHVFVVPIFPNHLRHPQGIFGGGWSGFGPVFEVGIQLSDPRLRSLQSDRLNSCLPAGSGTPARCPHRVTTIQQSATSSTSALAVGLVLETPPRQALLTISTLFHVQVREPQKNVILEAK